MPSFRLVFFVLLITASSCASYKQNIMFKTGDNVAKQVSEAEAAARNNVIQVNDLLKLEVYSNNGERLIDPNGELIKNNNGVIPPDPNAATQPSYLVTIDGMVRFPMIPPVAIAGLTIRDAEIKLQSEYSKYYKECYVLLTFSNKRVIVLGSPGGQVIPLVNENVSVVEVLAMAKGIGVEGKAHNIRLIRGDEVYLIDFSTIDGLKKGNITVHPNDIIYVETTRRPFVEASRDLSPVLSLVLSLSTLVVVFLANN